MSDWLRYIAMIFYAPMRGMREVRDRGTLLPAAICAYLSQIAYLFIVQWLVGRSAINQPQLIASNLFHAATSLLPVAIVLVPLLALTANMFDRRGSFGLVLQQEYASLASVVLYALIGANIVTILISIFFHFSGVQAAYVASSLQSAGQIKSMFNFPAEFQKELERSLSDPAMVAGSLFRTVKIGVFTVGTLEAVRKVFRLSLLRSIIVVLASYIGAIVLSPLWIWLGTRIIGSPFILLIVFLLLRGYFSSIVSNQRARAAFKQNLEAATINPRDSSAHYNLGLIHQQRGELSEARERFQRAIDIDPDELDAHYQLGRIARQQDRLPEAIGNFEQVVQRDQAHAQNEIWREIGATYLNAGQYGDARNALEKFLERRTNDPEGLYLIGRAYAGLGDQQGANSSMQACIDAVKTAPAYKYRTEKRWLNEAQQFLKGKRQEAVGSKQ
ncbi:MAG TPA: tetratricopeptide repeat protein [Pyrinomonadaceae bacterium]|nr:tetratricopeptide repeat protein [Pyrinomonadaceae bacterium]